MPQLVKKIIIRGYILAESGIMVGGNNTAFEIGGTDKTVVRNPVTRLPYIPGSSIKGKMRSLFELSRGQIRFDDRAAGPTLDPRHEAAQFFGHIKDNRLDREFQKQQPSRLIVRDGELLNPDDLKNAELEYTEVKAENSIDRITSEANPRFFERVPKGARFGLNMVINVFDHDQNGSHFLDFAFEALGLAQDDYLGGGGSRGNGQVRFVIDEILERPRAYYLSGQGESSIAVPAKFQKEV